MVISMLTGSPTFHQLVHAANLPAAIYGVDGAHPLRQIQIVRQGARQLHQQRVVGAEAVAGHGVNQALEVPVPVAVEPDLLGLFLRGEGLQGAGPVVATVGAVGGAWDQAAAPRAGAGAAAGFILLGAGGAAPPNFVAFVKVLQLEGLAQRHAVFWVTNLSHTFLGLLSIHHPAALATNSWSPGLNVIPGSVLHFITVL